MLDCATKDASYPNIAGFCNFQENFRTSLKFFLPEITMKNSTVLVLSVALSVPAVGEPRLSSCFAELSVRDAGLYPANSPMLAPASTTTWSSCVGKQLQPV